MTCLALSLELSASFISSIIIYAGSLIDLVSGKGTTSQSNGSGSDNSTVPDCLVCINFLGEHILILLEQLNVADDKQWFFQLVLLWLDKSLYFWQQRFKLVTCRFELVDTLVQEHELDQAIGPLELKTNVYYVPWSTLAYSRCAGVEMEQQRLEKDCEHLSSVWESQLADCLGDVLGQTAHHNLRCDSVPE